jgi:hypothetical protein
MFDVLAGKESIKANLTVGVDTKSIIYIGLGIFLAVTIGVAVGVLISKKV